MAAIDNVLSELNELFAYSEKLKIKGKPSNTQLEALALEYEIWYSKALAVVKQVLPDRLDDFKAAYGSRTQRSSLTVTISEFFLYTPNPEILPVLKPKDRLLDYSVQLLRQISILAAAQQAAPSVLRDIHTFIRAELLDTDVETAKELLKAKHLRSSGVVCGVALEAHLKSVFDRRGVVLKKKKPVLSDLNDEAKEKGIYDVPMWRFMQRLADIRNLCAHSGDREPTKSEVEDLISGTEKVIKEVF